MWGTAPSNLEELSKSWYASDDVDGKEVSGSWDLRSGITEYIGGFDVKNKRVLELGPASGYMTFAMERMGAFVTAIDTALDDPKSSWNFAPNPNMDVAKLGADRVAHLTQLRNAFWYAHRKHISTARVWYGDVLNLPADFGTYDVSTLTAVLLHCRDITGIMQSLAAHTEETMIVTERHWPGLPKLSLCHLETGVGKDVTDTWWRFTPEFFAQFLAALGFPNQTLTFHTQTSVRRNAEMPMFTIVANR